LEYTLPASSIIVPVPVPKANLRFTSNLRSLGRRLSRFKLFHPLRPLARSVLHTAEPAGKVLFDATPKIPSDSGCSTITVISANLWHDYPQFRRINERLDDFIELVKAESTDILLLQEVARTSHMKVEERLADGLNMAYVYSRANGHHSAIGFEEGLAIFSRYPMRKPSLRQLSKHSNPFTRRLVLGALLDSPCGNLFAFSTHLSVHSRQNAAQADQLRGWVRAVTGEHPAIIGGDFNADESKPQIKSAQRGWVDTFRTVNPTAAGTTHEIRGPFGWIWRRHRLDYIFLQPGIKNWQVLETRHVQIPHAPHSDHHAVLTRLALMEV
jgi:endonuclease/exonuclease/phosphatase family metal-dependent hydrolase